MKYVRREDYVGSPCIFVFEAALEFIFQIFFWVFWHSEYKRRYTDAGEGKDKA